MSFKPGIFIWSIENDYTQGRIPVDDTLGAMGVALFKAHDGLEFEIYSPDQIRSLAENVYRPQNIDMHPWGVARGWYAGWAYNEGRLAGEYAAATGRAYILDLEPYPEDYWQGVPGTPRAFCQGYSETSNGLRLRLCPDARNIGINLEEWVVEPIVDIWHPQAYYTAFATHDFRVGIMQAITPLLNAGVPKDKIYPVLPLWYATTGEPPIVPDELETVLRWVAREGFPGVAYWRRGLMDNKLVERLLAMDDPFSSLPTSNIIVPRAEWDNLRMLLEGTRISLATAQQKVEEFGA